MSIGISIVEDDPGIRKGLVRILNGGRTSSVWAWKNTPPTRHANGGTFAYADSHAEKWKWAGLSGEPPTGTVQNPAQQKDLNRLLLSVIPTLP